MGIIVATMTEFLIILFLVAASFVLLSIRVIIKRNGGFSSQHIAHNSRMQRDGIHCATSQDRESRRSNKHRIDVEKL